MAADGSFLTRFLKKVPSRYLITMAPRSRQPEKRRTPGGPSAHESGSSFAAGLREVLGAELVAKRRRTLVRVDPDAEPTLDRLVAEHTMRKAAAATDAPFAAALARVAANLYSTSPGGGTLAEQIAADRALAEVASLQQEKPDSLASDTVGPGTPPTNPGQQLPSHPLHGDSDPEARQVIILPPDESGSKAAEALVARILNELGADGQPIDPMHALAKVNAQLLSVFRSAEHRDPNASDSEYWRASRAAMLAVKDRLQADGTVKKAEPEEEESPVVKAVREGVREQVEPIVERSK